MVDSIVVIGKTTTTTTTTTPLSTTVRKKMVKLFLNHPHRGILKQILHLEAFTLFILENTLNKTKNEVYPTVRILLGFGIIEKAKTMKVGGAPPVVIYLVRGGNNNKVVEAQKLHFDLMPQGYVPSLEYYSNTRLVESLIVQVELSRLNKSVKKSEVIKFAKELGEACDYSLVLATLKHFREQGWEVEY